jgi:hypothetical protein
MKKSLTLGILLTVCFLAAVAQTGGTQDQVPPRSHSQRTTMQGCLSESSEDNFLLADKTRKSFQLRGNPAELNNLAGKEIQVDGIALSSFDSSLGSLSSSENSAESTGTATQSDVSQVRKVADTCSSSK